MMAELIFEKRNDDDTLESVRIELTFFSRRRISRFHSVVDDEDHELCWNFLDRLFFRSSQTAYDGPHRTHLKRTL